MAQDMNQVILIGRLTRDAELKYTGGGMAIGSFSLAVNRRVKNGDQYVDEASFFDVTLFGKTAENLNQYLTKGTQVCVSGELRQERWEQDGQKRSKVAVVGNNVQLLGRPADQAGGQGQSQGQNQQRPPAQQSPAGQQGPARGTPDYYNNPGGGTVPDDDIPF